MSVKLGFASKTAIVALSTALLAGNAIAGTRCASPEEMTALQVAALRQQLMVAGLVCSQADSFNRFVISYQAPLQVSDRTLLHYFIHRDGGDGSVGYNAYKTKLANDSSLHSLGDPAFCSRASYAFDAALNRNMALSDIVAQQPFLVDTDVEACAVTPSVTQASYSRPNLPAQHQDLIGSPQAAIHPAANGVAAPASGSATQNGEPEATNADSAQSGNPYRNAYYSSAASAPGYSDAAQMQGSDGRWYLASPR